MIKGNKTLYQRALIKLLILTPKHVKLTQVKSVTDILYRCCANFYNQSGSSNNFFIVQNHY